MGCPCPLKAELKVSASASNRVWLKWVEAFFFFFKGKPARDPWFLFFFLIISTFNYYLFIYWAVLGLRLCVRASSSCGKRGPLFIAVRGPLNYRGLSCCGAQAPDAQAQQLWLTGLVAPRPVGSSQTRARTRVPCISRQILNHCATREAPV